MSVYYEHLRGLSEEIDAVYNEMERDMIAWNASCGAMKTVNKRVFFKKQDEFYARRWQAEIALCRLEREYEKKTKRPWAEHKRVIEACVGLMQLGEVPIQCKAANNQ